MSYVYIKEAPKVRPHLPLIKIKLFIAPIFFVLGVFFFISAVFPIVQYQMEYSVKFNQIKTPLSARFYNKEGNVLGSLTTDYTQLTNWFTTDSNQSSGLSSSPSVSASYTISIPILKIKDAAVEVGSLDLKKSLIQYPQTALPGQLGNSVVFGHSVLPQFFNPKSYLTIFSTLFRLKQGDEIFVDFDSIRYKYLVEEMYEVQPTDLSVLEQRFDGRYLTLITCTPPGTYIRRLVVKARIVDF